VVGFSPFVVISGTIPLVSMLTTAGSTLVATSAKLLDSASGTFRFPGSPALALRSEIKMPIPMPITTANAVKTENMTKTFRKIFRSIFEDNSSPVFNIYKTPRGKNLEHFRV